MPSDGSDSGGPYAVLQFGGEIIEVDSALFQGVPVAYRYRLIFERFSVDSDAKRCTCLVLTPIASAYGTFLIVKYRHVLFQLAVDFSSNFRHSIFFHQWEDRGFYWGNSRVKSHYCASLHLALFVGSFIFGECFAQKRQHTAVCTG